MDILFLSHCVPNPPNKGEKIRARQVVTRLAERCRVHLVCFARSRAEAEAAQELRDRCASVYAEVRSFTHSLAWAGVRFAAGDSLYVALFRSRTMRAYVQELSRRVPLSATVAYALPMVSHAPSGVPMLLDMQDVDSEKWFQYARMRRFGFLYEIEARRLRARELRSAGQAVATFLTARQETALLRSLAPSTAVVECMENGVDFDYFHPDRIPRVPDLACRRFIAFVGTMDYYPNIDAASWFAREVYPAIRRHEPSLEFLVVGNHPAKAVLELARIPGVSVTGGVPDVRPYLAGARALVTPLRLARGIQNKVLEGLALGRQVCATAAVCRTFGEEVPPGVIRCDSPAEFAGTILGCAAREPQCDPDIRDHTRRRFSWRRNLEPLVNALEAMKETAPIASHGEAYGHT